MFTLKMIFKKCAIRDDFRISGRKYQNPRNKTEFLFLLKKHNKQDIFVIFSLVWLIIYQCIA